MSRFHEPQRPDFQRLNSSVAFDRRLWPQDIARSRAHARMLATRGIITDADLDELLRGLGAVELELTVGQFAFQPEDEDVHMALERRLTEVAGAVAGKLHTARSLATTGVGQRSLGPGNRHPTAAVEARGT